MRTALFKQIQYSSLAFCLVVFFFLYPVFEAGKRGGVLLETFLIWLIVSAVFSVIDRKGFNILLMTLAVITVLMRWTIDSSVYPSGAVGGLAAFTLLIALVTYLILRDILTAPRVTPQIIFGAICVYLLFAMLMANCYNWLWLQDDAHLNFQADSFGPALYFSLVTLTTLGYGDLAPLSPTARALASLEALIGQLYLAVLIARFVGIYSAGKRDEQ